MIRNGSTVVLRTRDAIYSTCKITTMSKDNVTVTYCAGIKRDRETGKLYEDRQIETIPRKKIICISERY